MQLQDLDHIGKMSPTRVHSEPNDVMKEAADTEQNHSTGDEVHQNHERIAQAVAKLLKPTIMEAVDVALSKSLQLIREQVEAQEQHMKEAKSSIETVEEDVAVLFSATNAIDKIIKTLMKKSRRSGE